MKRYKLKKDLPTFKAGKECWLGVDGQLLAQNEDDEVIQMYSAKTMQKFPNILKDWFEEISEEPRSADSIQIGDKYYFLDSCRSVNCDVWGNTLLDRERRAHGNCYLVEEEAMAGAAWLKAYQILRQDTKGFKPQKGKGRYYTIYWDVYDRKFRVDYYTSDLGGARQYSPLIFATREDAEGSLKKHKREWKIYLGVEE